MKYFNYAKVAFFLAMIILSVGCCSKKIMPKSFVKHGAIGKSDIFLIGKTVEVLLPNLDGPPESSEELQAVPYSMSSGTGVSISSNKNYSDILTAGHVCATEKMPAVIGDQFQTTFTLLDFGGNSYSADLIAVDLDADLCLLRIYKPTQPISVSNRDMVSGDVVHYSGYPLGIYSPNTLHHFSGQFSGSDMDGFFMYSLPAAPGASGSPIVDDEGKLVGLISAIPQEFDHLTIGPGTQRIKAFLFLSSDCTKYCVDQ